MLLSAMNNTAQGQCHWTGQGLLPSAAPVAAAGNVARPNFQRGLRPWNLQLCVCVCQNSRAAAAPHADKVHGYLRSLRRPIQILPVLARAVDRLGAGAALRTLRSMTQPDAICFYRIIEALRAKVT